MSPLIENHYKFLIYAIIFSIISLSFEWIRRWRGFWGWKTNHNYFVTDCLHSYGYLPALFCDGHVLLDAGGGGVSVRTSRQSLQNVYSSQEILGTWMGYVWFYIYYSDIVWCSSNIVLNIPILGCLEIGSAVRMNVVWCVFVDNLQSENFRS